MKGSKILVTAHPRGYFRECIISGTPKPGTVMTLVAATAAVASRFTYIGATPGGDGQRCTIAVLLEDSNQGKTYADAYADGDQGFLYFPLPGDELNMLLQDVAGTGDDFAIGDLLIVDNGTGKLIATTGTPESEPFQLLEAATNPTADHWEWCMATGQ